MKGPGGSDEEPKNNIVSETEKGEAVGGLEEGGAGEEKAELSPIEKGKAELEKARQFYAEKHYGATKKLGLIKRFLPVKTEVGGVEEVKASYGRYKEAMSGLLDLQLKEIKEKKERGEIDAEGMKKEMGELVKYYSLDEKTNLFEARTNARTKALEYKTSEKILKFATKIINGYRKLDWKWKAAIAVGLFATGTGLYLGGSVAALGAFTSARRLWAGTLFGTGVTAGLESYQRRKEIKEEGKLERRTLRDLDLSKEEEDKFSALKKVLNGQIEKYDQVLSEELKSAKTRKLVGAAAGFASAFVLPGVMKHFLGSENAVSHTGESAHGAAKVAAHHAAEKVTQHGSENVASHAGDAAHGVVKEAVHNVAGKATQHATELTVEKGSSIEGTLIKQLIHDGIEPEKAGDMAHDMAKIYARDHGLGDKGMYSNVQPGTHIRMEYDPTKGRYRISEVSGGGHKMGWLINEHPQEHKTQYIAGQHGRLPIGEPIKARANYDQVSNWNWDATRDVEKINNLHGMYEYSQSLKQEIENIQNKIWNLYHGETPEQNTFTDNPWDYDKVKQWNGLQEDLQNAQNNYKDYLKSIKNKQEVFAKMWGATFKGSTYPLNEDAVDFLNSTPSPKNEKLFKFMNSMVKKLEIDVDKKGHETLLQLSHRISNAIMMKGFPK